MDITSYLLGKKASGGSAPVLQDKEVTITENGETEITADSGYDGLSSVNVTTDVPTGITPTGTINITTNGTHDVTTYASANVNVPSQKYAPKYIKFGSYTGNNLDYEVANLDTSNITDMYQLFYNCQYISSLNLSGWNTSNVTIMQYTFYNCSRITSITNINFDTSQVTTMLGMFQNCSNLTSLDLSSFSSSSVGNINYMFSGCSKLEFLDVRNMVFSTLQIATDMLKNVPTTCEIIVKDNTEKAWFNTKFPSYTNVKTVAEIGE